jgi:hypothetical protein
MAVGARAVEAAAASHWGMMQDLRHDPTVNQALDLVARHGRMTWRKRT